MQMKKKQSSECYKKTVMFPDELSVSFSVSVIWVSFWVEEELSVTSISYFGSKSLEIAVCIAKEYKEFSWILSQNFDYFVSFSRSPIPILVFLGGNPSFFWDVFAQSWKFVWKSCVPCQDLGKRSRNLDNPRNFLTRRPIFQALGYACHWQNCRISSEIHQWKKLLNICNIFYFPAIFSKCFKDTVPDY